MQLELFAEVCSKVKSWSCQNWLIKRSQIIFLLFFLLENKNYLKSYLFFISAILAIKVPLWTGLVRDWALEIILLWYVIKAEWRFAKGQ